jgi:hypothetical protein
MSVFKPPVLPAIPYERHQQMGQVNVAEVVGLHRQLEAGARRRLSNASLILKTDGQSTVRLKLSELCRPRKCRISNLLR